MARKKKPEEHENHERWLVSYADFITLLFAFFVVMYSISSVNEGKYRVLSDSMTAAFRTSARSLTPIQVGQLSRSAQDMSPSPISSPKPMVVRPAPVDLKIYSKELTDSEDWALDDASEQIDKLADDVESALAKLIDDELVQVRRNRLSLEVEIKTSILFGSASAAPSRDAREVLQPLGNLLSSFPNSIHVEGFTDNLPINTPVYPSNWELSSGRAAAVVRLFSEAGVVPERLASVGYGQYRPIADNRTAEGRAKNRRVVVVVMAFTPQGQGKKQQVAPKLRSLEVLTQTDIPATTKALTDTTG